MLLSYVAKTQTDSIKRVADTAEVKDTLHSPKKAAILSAVLPGAGQFYNKKYWKMPIVYGLLGTAGYFFHTNNKEFKELKAVFIETEDSDTFTALEKARRNRDLLAMAFIGVYILQIVDASVDAHLFYFDVSDDLSLNWSPQFMFVEPNSTKTSFGLALRVQF